MPQSLCAYKRTYLQNLLPVEAWLESPHRECSGQSRAGRRGGNEHRPFLCGPSAFTSPGGWKEFKAPAALGRRHPHAAGRTLLFRVSQNPAPLSWGCSPSVFPATSSLLLSCCPCSPQTLVLSPLFRSPFPEPCHPLPRFPLPPEHTGPRVPTLSPAAFRGSRLGCPTARNPAPGTYITGASSPKLSSLLFFSKPAETLQFPFPEIPG